MEKDIKVIKVYPKIQGNYVKEFNINGFMTCESKKSALLFKKNKNDDVSIISEKIDEFIQCANKFGLKYSFDVEQVVTYCEKQECVTIGELDLIIDFE